MPPLLSEGSAGSAVSSGLPPRRSARAPLVRDLSCVIAGAAVAAVTDALDAATRPHLWRQLRGLVWGGRRVLRGMGLA